MTTSKLVVSEEASSLATRIGGRALRDQLLTLLQSAHHVTVDFADVTLTPSFADEFLGGVIEKIGRDQFRQAISIVNVSDHGRPLVRHVLNQRSKSHAQHA